MLKHLKTKSEFSRNVLTLMTGTTIARAIPIAISPIITRIYTPEDFGILALFMAITSIFGSIASGRYELAIMLPRKDENAINIVALAFIITTFLSIMLLVIVLLFHDYFVNLLNNTDIGMWLYFVPISVFFIGLFNILNYFNIRQKNYQNIANVTIIKSIIGTVVQLSVGFIKSGASGLIGGYMIAQMFANMKLLNNIVRDKMIMSKITKTKIIACMKRYKNFPKYSMWAILANSLSLQLINILMSSLFSVATLGLYSLVQRVVGMPSILIGASISQVFFQQATKEKQQSGKAVNTFNSTVKKLILIGFPLFSFLFLIAEDLFAIVFGEDWRIAGIYAQIIMPLFFVRFVSSTVSTVLIIYEKQKMELFINIVLVVLSVFLIFIFDDFMTFLNVYSIIISLYYVFLLLYYYRLSKGL